jgi:outer membrane biosynthesis protein TonB
MACGSVEERPVEPQEQPPAVAAPEPAESPAPAPAEEPAPAPTSAARVAVDDSAPSDAAIDEAISNSEMLKLLTAEGAGTSRYEESDKGAALASQLAEDGAAEDKPKDKLVSRAKFVVDDIDETTLDPDKVTRKIRSRYLVAMRRCHQVTMKKVGPVGGAVRIRFTVSKRGKTAKASARGFNADLDQCLEKLMRGWKWPVPRNDDGKPVAADFVMKLILKPRS